MWGEKKLGGPAVDFLLIVFPVHFSPEHFRLRSKVATNKIIPYRNK